MTKFKIIALSRTDNNKCVFGKLAKLHHQAFKDIGQNEKDFHAFLSTKEETLLVAMQGTVLLGYILFAEKEDELYLQWLAVKKPFQKTGIAKKLISKAELYAKSKKLKSVMLDTRNRFRSAICLYLNMNYKIIGTWTNSNDLMIRLRKVL
jgi:ribosomal protein S18 acetylase RimI-like enzyme